MGYFSNLDIELSKWDREDLEDLLANHPNFENLSDAELEEKASQFYWEAQGLFDQANNLEIQSSTTRKYIEIRKKMKK